MSWRLILQNWRLDMKNKIGLPFQVLTLAGLLMSGGARADAKQAKHHHRNDNYQVGCDEYHELPWDYGFNSLSGYGCRK
jgi:hypothetical protein